MVYIKNEKQTKGMSPLCVSHYHVSPDLMGLTVISTITTQFPVEGRHAQTQQSFGGTGHFFSKQEKSDRKRF